MNQNLLDLERARLLVSGVTASDDRLLEFLLAASSDAIRAWCGRGFALREADELHDGTEAEHLLLRHWPVQAIASVRGCPCVVLEITNTTAEQARAAVGRDGLELVSVVSGVKSLDTSVTWASNPTLGAVVTAVAARGDGWQARSQEAYASFPASDLFVSADTDRSAGALACAGTWAGFRLHVQELADYLWRPSGLLERPALLYPWSGGGQAWRVQYTAGFVTVPEAVSQACGLWLADLFGAARRDPSLSHQAIAGQIAQDFRAPDAAPPPRVQALLAPYRARRV